MVRIGQDGSSSAHFVAFGNKKAYLFYCSCDAFILAFSEKYHYVEEMSRWFLFDCYRKIFLFPPKAPRVAGVVKAILGVGRKKEGVMKNEHKG